MFTKETRQEYGGRRRGRRWPGWPNHFVSLWDQVTKSSAQMTQFSGPCKGYCQQWMGKLKTTKKGEVNRELDVNRSGENNPYALGSPKATDRNEPTTGQQQQYGSFKVILKYFK